MCRALSGGEGECLCQWELKLPLTGREADCECPLYLYQEASVNGKEYLPMQGGLGNHREDKDLEEYDLHELVWSRMDYEKKYYEEFYSQANMLK